MTGFKNQISGNQISGNQVSGIFQSQVSGPGIPISKVSQYAEYRYRKDRNTAKIAIPQRSQYRNTTRSQYHKIAIPQDRNTTRSQSTRSQYHKTTRPQYRKDRNTAKIAIPQRSQYHKIAIPQDRNTTDCEEIVRYSHCKISGNIKANDITLDI